MAIEIIEGMNFPDDLLAMLLTTDQLLSRGMTSHTVRGAVESGELIRLRPGFFVDGRARELQRRDRHLLAVLAADIALDAPVFSHSSAALIHGLPDWGLPLRKVTVCEEGPEPRTRSSALTTFRSVPELSGHLMTADAALHNEIVTREALDGALDGAAGRRGIRRARHKMSLVDGRSESVAETLSRLIFRDFGLPEPETQVEIRNPRGVLIARVDFLWSEYGVIGECDGFGKYFDGLTPAETRRRLGKEKDRDAELMALGYRVLHWRWRDLEEPHALATRSNGCFVTPQRDP